MFTSEALEARFKFPFSALATDVVNYAEQKARRLNQLFIGPDHLFLGYLSHGEPRLLMILTGKGHDRIADWVRFLTVNGRGDSPKEIDFTQLAEKGMKFGIKEAQRLHDVPLQPEHILLGLVRLREGPVAVVLEASKITLAGARSAVQMNRIPRRLEAFFQDPTRSFAEKQQVLMIVKGALELASPSQEPNRQLRLMP